jgi:hypothetical protein
VTGVQTCALPILNGGDELTTDYTSGSNSTEVPSGSGNYFNYRTWDGVVYYYDSGSNGYYTGYYNEYNASYGDYITEYNGVYYYWDGIGGYYS